MTRAIATAMSEHSMERTQCREHVRRHQLRREIAPVDVGEQTDQRQRDEQDRDRGRDEETEERASRDAPGHDGFRNPSSSNCA